VEAIAIITAVIAAVQLAVSLLDRHRRYPDPGRKTRPGSGVRQGSTGGCRLLLLFLLRLGEIRTCNTLDDLALARFEQFAGFAGIFLRCGHVCVPRSVF
jgi:hypothetical protein